MDQQANNTQRGVILALGAYTMWGIAPIYFKSLQHVSPLEILSHRGDLVIFLPGRLNLLHQELGGQDPSSTA